MILYVMYPDMIWQVFTLLYDTLCYNVWYISQFKVAPSQGLLVIVNDNKRHDMQMLIFDINIVKCFCKAGRWLVNIILRGCHLLLHDKKTWGSKHSLVKFLYPYVYNKQRPGSLLPPIS